MVSAGEFLDTYGPPAESTETTVEEAELYRGRIPDDLVDFWKRYGIGTYADHKYTMCTPRLFDSYLQTLLTNAKKFKGTDFAAFGYSCMGNIDLWHCSGKYFTYDIATASLTDWTSLTQTSAIPYDIDALANIAGVTKDVAERAFLEGRKNPESIWNVMFSMADEEFYKNILDEYYNPLIPLLKNKYGKMGYGQIFFRDKAIFENTADSYNVISIDEAKNYRPSEIFYTEYIESGNGQVALNDIIKVGKTPTSQL